MRIVKPSRFVFDSIYTDRIRDKSLYDFDNRAAYPSFANLTFDGTLTQAAFRRYVAAFRRHWPPSCSQALLDLGCGFGRFGARLAVSLGKGLIGVDFSHVALRQASKLDTEARVETSRFVQADFCALPLAARSVGGVISLDALYLASDPRQSVIELKRVLVSQAPLLFTVLEYPKDIDPDRDDRRLKRWLVVLSQFRFRVLARHDVSTQWRRYMRFKHGRRWANRHRLRQRLGGSIEAELAVSAQVLGLTGRPFVDRVCRYEVFAIHL